MQKIDKIVDVEFWWKICCKCRNYLKLSTFSLDAPSRVKYVIQSLFIVKEVLKKQKYRIVPQGGGRGKSILFVFVKNTTLKLEK